MIKPIIRSATAADLPRCLSFDTAFETDYVWQMDSRLQEGQTTISFRTVRLPRPMKVAYPRDTKQLNAAWDACDAMLVADDNRTLVGYAALAKRGAQAAAWVQDLIVSKSARRQGVGSALLTGVIRWAREEKLSWITIEVQTKNYPAIQFCQKHGFTFCGYNDHFFANQDIAVFFTKAVH
jgi:ribosomal protein S18 acetylase RimI-like enzyme